jgi:hypothetical protein
MRPPITLGTLLSPSMISQGLPAEKEALLMQFLDFYPNATFMQYQEFSASPASPFSFAAVDESPLTPQSQNWFQSKRTVISKRKSQADPPSGQALQPPHI